MKCICFLRQCLTVLLQESRIYAVAKSGMRVSEASPGARGPGRGEPPAARNKKLHNPLHFVTSETPVEPSKPGSVLCSGGRKTLLSVRSFVCVCVCMCVCVGVCQSLGGVACGVGDESVL